MKEIINEMLAKAKECKSVEELKALAAENKFEISDEELERVFSKYCSSGELADEELDNVSGGCSPFVPNSCPKCGSKNIKSFQTIDESTIWCGDCLYNF